MRRRAFIAGLAGAAALPFRAGGQTELPVIGYLSARSADVDGPMLSAFRQGLAEIGYVEGRDVRIEIRFADGQYDRLPALMDDLIKHKVAAVTTGGGLVSVAVAKKATATIPIVFTSSDDPVRLGLVASLNRPGGNATGINFFVSQMEGKRQRHSQRCFVR